MFGSGKYLGLFSFAVSIVAIAAIADGVGCTQSLPGRPADPTLVAQIHARQGIAKACAATQTNCSGNRPPNTVCLVAAGGGGCAPRVINPPNPDTGEGAPCGTCTGLVHNTCSGVALTPPLLCWETSISCCNVNPVCATTKDILDPCQCLVTSTATQPIGVRIMCWNAVPPKAGGTPPQPDPLPDPPQPP
jgi:hypothetical protein